MRPTTALEKLSASVINVLAVFAVFIPFIFLNTSGQSKKLIFCLLFLAYNIVIIFVSRNRCLGMYVTNTYWQENYSMRSQVAYAFLYTLSFVSLLFWYFFPGDLLLVNLLLVQLPFVLLTKTTFHGYFSGNMLTVTKNESLVNERNRWFVTISYFFLCGMLPLITLVYDFGISEFTEVTTKIYSDLFFYALTAGFLIPFFLYKPFRLLWDARPKKRTKLILMVSLALALATTTLDFFRGNHAIWEVNEEYHKQTFYVNERGKSLTLSEFYLTPSDSLAREHYAGFINNAASIKNFNQWSVTRFAYVTSVFIQSFFMYLFMFAATILFARHRSLEKHENYKESVASLLICGLLILMWLLLKLSSDFEKQALYETINLKISNLIIPILLTLALLFSSVVYYNRFQEYIKPVLTIASTIGISGITIFSVFNKDFLATWFGRKAEIGNYFVILIFFVILAFVFQLITEESEDEDLSNGGDKLSVASHDLDQRQ